MFTGLSDLLQMWRLAIED